MFTGKTHEKKLTWGRVILLTAVAALVAGFVGFSSAAKDTPGTAEDAAVKQVVAGFSGGWNRHDAGAMCASLADDVRWVSWRGEVYSSRDEVQSVHAKLFADLYKNTHRTDEVKSIKYVGNVASVDDYWSMTGARTRDGADWPYRAGYANFLMAKRQGRWIVISAHTADFNAKAPAN